jgi:hypothetical protein
MKSSVRLKYKQNAMYEVRRAPEVVALLEEQGERVAEAANSTLPEGVGYRMSSSQGRKNPQGRWAVRVYTSSDHAKRSNAINNTLLRALGSI